MENSPTLSAESIRHFFETSLIADALGVPVEFEARGTYHVDGMTGHGTYDQPVGTWSDDSSLTLALMAILTAGGDPTTLMQAFTRYLQGDFTPFGECFDVGNTTAKAIRTFNLGAPATEAGDPSEFANGNGAIMRLAPLAFSLRHEPDAATRRQIITAYTQVTHRHPRSVVGSVLYVELLRALLAGQDLDQALATSWALAADLPECDSFTLAWSPDLSDLPVSAIPSTGYVVDTLVAAVWCNRQTRDIAQVILTAANLGGDTDTIAQIAACIAAAQPAQQLPPAWRDQLVWTQQARTIIAEFAAKYGD